MRGKRVSLFLVEISSRGHYFRKSQLYKVQFIQTWIRKILTGVTQNELVIVFYTLDYIL